MSFTTQKRSSRPRPGVSELFPVSSSGTGLTARADRREMGEDMSMSTPNSPYLDILVAAHVGTAIALVVFFWHDWVRIVGGLLTSIRIGGSRPTTSGWLLLVIGTIPVGVAGILLDKIVQHDLGKPIPASVFPRSTVLCFRRERICATSPTTRSS